MILMRITGVKGSCKIQGYEREKDAWFPVDSAGFGFQADRSSRKGRKKKRKSRYEDDLDDDEEEEGPSDFSELSVDKPIDSATCDLMYFAMRDRTKTKVDRQTVNVDIHFVGLAGTAGGVHAFLRIRLEDAVVSAWSISGSDDNRPTESFSIKFDRCAMQYHATEDGKTFRPAGRRGWDQVENKEWDTKTSFFP
jgi:type VI protein secretion system component Hcp